MGPTADEVFDGIFILLEFGLLFMIASAAVWIWEKLKQRRHNAARLKAFQRRAEWAAEIERAGIKLMNDTAVYSRKAAVKRNVIVKGAFADMADVWK